ncbi:MAG: phage DNA packaging protein J [Saprospiraceae bacterium]|nr:phage DNA packaging protein J [Saprospiraceae bacterium]
MPRRHQSKKPGRPGLQNPIEGTKGKHKGAKAQRHKDAKFLACGQNKVRRGGFG